jgi:hypothetical protein
MDANTTILVVEGSMGVDSSVAKFSIEDSLTFHSKPQFSPGLSGTKESRFNVMDFKSFILKLHLASALILV